MTWLVVLAILMLIKTQFFSIRRNSILFGLFLGLGMMTKGTFFLFIFGPLSYSVFRIFKQSNKNAVVILKDNFLNLAMALAIALLICGDRYLNLNVLYHHSTQFICESSGLRPLFYIKDLIHKQISFPFFVIFVVSLIYLFIKKKKENETILLLYFFIPFLYLSLMLHRKETRYMLPLLPAIAIISASFLNSIARRKLRMDMIFLLFSIGLLQFYDFSFGIGFNFDKLGIRQNNQEDYSKIHRPISQDKNYYKRLLEIFLLHVDYPEKAKVLALPDERRVLRVQEWNNLKWLRMVPFDLELISIDSSTVKTISNSIPRADFIIYIGRQDLKNKSVFQSYIKMMFEQQIDHIKTHPFIVTPSVYRQLLKGNCAILYPQNYLDLTKLSNDFLNFKLIAKYQLDAEQYIYIYKCIEKKLNEN
jgi:hypothetical protein